MSDRYEIREKIGQGGIGAVYKAYDTQLKREVAIKRMLPDERELKGERSTDIMLKEATTLSALQHPNIITVYDVGVDSEGAFVVMELLKGETLDQTIQRGVLTLKDFREVVIQTLEALIAAEDRGIVHRDLKPTNIMVIWLPSGKFQMKILDFGLAKFSRQPELQTIDHGDSILGSIYFMAPEQFERAPLDVRTDLYSMGCMYYQALAGQYPFQGETAAQVMASHLQNRVTHLKYIRNDLPENICDWVMWLLAREKDDRPANASSCLREFQGIIREVNTAGMNSAPDIKSNAKGLSKQQNLTSRRLIIPKGDADGASGPGSQTELQTPKGATTRSVAPQKVSNRSVSIAGIFLALSMAAVAIIGVIAFNRFSENKNKEAEFLALAKKENKVGDANTVDLLVDFLQLEKEHPNHFKTAGVLLSNLKGPGVEERIIDHLKKGDTAYKIRILGVIGSRDPKPREAVLEVLKLTSSSDPKLRKEASRVLHGLAGDRDLSFLVEAFKKEKSSRKRMDLTKTIGKICKNSENPDGCRNTLLATFQTVSGPTHNQLLELLGYVGNSEVLDLVKTKIESGDPQAKAAAFRAFHNWPNSDAADFVFNLAISPDTDDAGRMALTEAYLKMASLDSTPIGDKKEMFGHLLELASNVKTMNKVYHQLGMIPEKWALELAEKEDRQTYQHPAQIAAEKIKALIEARLNP